MTEGRGFYDTASTGNPVINDGEYHTLKIVMKGTMAYQFMDDTMTAAWDTTAASAENGGHLSQALTSGGFALIVNRSSIAIDSVEISRRAAPVRAAEAPRFSRRPYCRRRAFLLSP